jgi:predicted nucleic acid-binding protein
LEYENDLNPYDTRRETISQWQNIATDDIDQTIEVVNFAEELTRLGIKVKDALHISCAVHTKCKYFITTDKKLLNTPIDEIIIVSPIQFIDEMEE